MKLELIGKKIGMTQIYDENNNLVPVTVVQAGPCPVTQVKTLESDGYNAVQIAYGVNKEHRLTAPELGTSRRPASKPTRTSAKFALTKPPPSRSATSSPFRSSKPVSSSTSSATPRGAASRAS